MKNKFAALIAATFVATSASAGGFENQVFANENVKVMELSQTEMKETQGEWGPFAGLIAAGGGAYGAWNHQLTVKKHTGQWASPQSTIVAAGIGAGSALTLGKLQGVNTVLLQGGAYGNTHREINRIKGK